MHFFNFFVFWVFFWGEFGIRGVGVKAHQEIAGNNTDSEGHRMQATSRGGHRMHEPVKAVECT